MAHVPTTAGRHHLRPGRRSLAAMLMAVGGLLAGSLQAGTTDSVRDYTHALLAGEDLPFPGLVVDEHPALPWLKMAWMRPRLAELDPGEVATFISRYRDRPFAGEFRRDWLLALGESEQWRDFARHYRGERDQTLRCYAHQARLAAGRRESVHRQAAGLWLTGRTLPAACDPLFESAREAGAITDYMVAERYRLALRADNLALAEELAPAVGTAAVDRVARERQLRDEPRAVLATVDPAGANPAATELAARAIRRLARKQPREAAEHWEGLLAAGLEPSGYQRFMVQRRLALEAAREHLPEATEWLADTSAQDDFIQVWRVRNALRTGNWPNVLTAIDRLDGKHSRQWRYWRARALEATGEQGQAERLYRQLADRQDYYGLLAARRIDEPTQLQAEPIDVREETVAELASDDGLELARKLLDIGWTEAARMEWRAALEGRDRGTRCQAALLAARWDWASEAAITAARAGCRGDPSVDYPLAFADLMQTQAERLELDPAWAWSIMRSESLFATDARSHVGALGLMQLMPATAREMAAGLDMELASERDILDPTRNITLGTGYLRKMLDRFDNHPLVATAAYNAGPHRAEDWLPRTGVIAGDVWAETIPFRETRRYIRRVMQHSLRYDQRLGREDDGLVRRLGPVVSDTLAACTLPGEREGNPLPDAC